MNILQLIETEFAGETNPGNYMGPDIDAFGVVTNNSDAVTHSPETEAERRKRKKDKEEMENTSGEEVKESKQDILDELLDDPEVQKMLAKILSSIHVDNVHESANVDKIVSDLLEEHIPAGDIGPATAGEWRELATFDAKDVMKAIEVESEHTTNKAVAAKISLSHFREDPDYYTKLERVEGEKPYVKTS